MVSVRILVASVTAAAWAQQCTLLDTDVNYIGNDIGSTQQEDPAACCDDCQANSGCKVYTWVDGVCYLKSEQGESNQVSGAISGVLSTQSDPIDEPTDAPSDDPTDSPSDDPTDSPSDDPTDAPSDNPSDEPSDEPSSDPTEEPTEEPTEAPTPVPSTPAPVPTPAPTPQQPTSPIKLGASGTDCLEAPGGVLESGSRPFRTACDGSPAQQWIWTKSQALYNGATKMCLDSSPFEGDAPVYLSKCTLGWTQTWQVQSNSSLGHPTKTKCLTADATSWLKDCRAGDDSQVVDMSHVTPAAPLAPGFEGLVVRDTLCLEYNISTNIVATARCDRANRKQMWSWNSDAKELKNTNTVFNWLVWGHNIVHKTKPDNCLGFGDSIPAVGQSPELVMCNPSDDSQSFSFVNFS
ncbi:Aste57867_15092 [Aphanomyces stellatus]|uniref:Aste57867_15092 protein n=1 Tax=Aphanomyces stellatus TaxID=120398 RepID=A0A485L3L7_9STRA|nr:hypothetical protein As57867_015036 [Aphanomyces stellatus]VFT91905.1 Aste57867_15092 [Aphanomyces stellatus]